MVDEQSLVREDGILSELERNGRVTVSDLSERFGVSAVTIRKDLDSLERRSLLRRIRGGAVVAAPVEEGAFAERLHRNAAEKKAVARMAAQLVRDGDVVAIDSSTTAFFLMLELLTRRDLIVVTNSLRGATLLSDESNATVVMPGGIVRRASNSTSGPIGDVLRDRGRIRLGFFGCAAISPKLGLLELASSEGESKRMMAEACEARYAVLDRSKTRAFGVHAFLAPDEITEVLTAGPDDGFEAAWKHTGVPIRRARSLAPVAQDEGAAAPDTILGSGEPA